MRARPLCKPPEVPPADPAVTARFLALVIANDSPYLIAP